MRGFKSFISEDEDVRKTLDKLPASHRALVKGYSIRFEPRNTLHGDDKHVGFVTTDPKEIRVASPWNYGREFALLHEIGHLVYDKMVRGRPLEKEWAAVAARTKNKKKNEPPEELFCHAYAATYCKHPPVIHYHGPWVKFIRSLSTPSWTG